jgi:hypothetical protein
MMRATRQLLGWIPFVLVVAMTSSVAGAEPAPDEGRPAPAAPSPTMWLKGPFGKVIGGPPDLPATALPDQRPLDTWMRSAYLQLLSDVEGRDVRSLHVVARPVGGSEAIELSDGVVGFAGPDAPGRYVITATLETAEASISEHAWLVEVPDRGGEPELLWEMPAPTALLSTVGTSDVAGIPGHGCYVYLCVEAGYRPSTDSLEPVQLAPGEHPRLRLDDGSAMVHWVARLESPAVAGTPIRQREGGSAGAPFTETELTGLVPPTPGIWLLEVRADYDRERGWQWFVFRLDVD